MILVTVGSTDFDALVRAMDELAPELGEEVVMQIGAGSYEPRHASGWFRYAPSLEGYYDRAEIVVSHGGLGTVVEVLRKGKRLVAASNPDRYDAHQDDILGTLAEAGHLVWCRDLARLRQDLATVRAATLTPYVEPECRIHLVIHEFLEQRASGQRRH
jgi:UDP-N-acetylglucosamine transferase subunit ALG13